MRFVKLIIRQTPVDVVCNFFLILRQFAIGKPDQMLKSHIFLISDLSAVLLEFTIQKNIALIVDCLFGLQNLLHFDYSDKWTGHGH
jgi:hypothetical protein